MANIWQKNEENPRSTYLQSISWNDFGYPKLNFRVYPNSSLLVTNQQNNKKTGIYLETVVASLICWGKM